MSHGVKKVLILAPHTDDGELGAGGAIARYVEEGVEVKYVAFSDCSESLPEGYANGTLAMECHMAMGTLGVKDVSVLDFPVRNFDKYRQRILDALIKIRTEYSPDVVFLPSSHDNHQDHAVIHQEGVRAFKGSSLFGYFFLWNSFKFDFTGVVELDEGHIEKKMKAIECYKSQSQRFYCRDGYMKSVAKTVGASLGVKFAEVFECIRVFQKL